MKKMKKGLQVLVMCFLVSSVFSQSYDVAKIRTCIGKVTTILKESTGFEDRKLVNPKCAIDYNSDDFKNIWQSLTKQTENLKSVKTNKIYEIKAIGEGFDDPIEWRITFLNKSFIQFSQSCQMGTSYIQDYFVKYDIETNQYQTKYTRGSKTGPTYTVEIKNDIVINKHIDN